MLASNRNFAICHNLASSRTQLRLASTSACHLLTIAKPSQPHIRCGSKTLDISRIRTLGHALSQTNVLNAPHVAHLSTSGPLSVRPRPQEGKFLKPRSKPKFRQRTEEENDEFFRALKDAEAEYKYQVVKDSGSAQDGGSSPEAFSSPFFTTPDFQSSRTVKTERLQPHDSSFSSFRQGLPRLTRVPRSEASTADLENELYFLSHKDPHPTAIHNILKILVYERKIEPKSQYYEAQILANTWPEHGSVDNVQKILSEMEIEGLEIGANIISAVLKVLAIRPSIELSYYMLLVVERRWIQLSSETHHHLILAMIRTRQTEIAAWMLDVLRDKNKTSRSWDREVVPDYLVVLLIAELVKTGDWEGILRYMYKLRNRRAADRDIPVKFWGWVLERAAKAARQLTESSSTDQLPALSSTKPQQPAPIKSQLHYTTLYVQTQHMLSLPAIYLTRYIYTMYVAPMSHRPSYTTLLDILHLAANTGTPSLAHSVVATITYMDGIDDTGAPVVHISNDVKELVELAETRAIENEPEESRKQNETEMQLEIEKKRIKLEDEKWWEEVFQLFSEDEHNPGKPPAGEASLSKVPSEPRPEVEADRLSRLNKDNTATPPSNKETQPTINDGGLEPKPVPESKHKEDKTPPTLPDRKFLPFDPEKVPPGNLWPVFPAIGKLGSAYVDPWEALGPRMSSRRKWTDAQKDYKLMERAGKKKY